MPNAPEEAAAATARPLPELARKPGAAPPQLANGLVYVDSDMPGLARVRHGNAFRYRDPDGKWLGDKAEIGRINKLAIPPAYESVWICPLPNGHLQATGLDARGRKQYRYHADWRVQKDEAKFDRLEAFGRALPRIRARVARDLAAGSKRRAAAPTRDAVLAAVVRLLDTTYLRIGNEEYAASNRSFGLTTLRNRHAALKGNALTLRFRGKSGVAHEAKLDDPRVARVVRGCQQLRGQSLFGFEDEDGTPRKVDSSDVNDYLGEASGEDFTAKDFRTWHGTVQALELTRAACHDAGVPATDALQRYSAKAILTAVAAQLGNTPAVCKKAYVHPAVLALGGQLSSSPDAIAAIWSLLAGARPKARLHAAEARLLAFLVRHHAEARRSDRAARVKKRSSKAPT